MTAVCPRCASAKIDSGPPILGDYTEVGAGERAVCLDCGWSGLRKELLVLGKPSGIVDVQQALDIAADVASAYLKGLAELAARPIGLAMVGSGVVGAKDTPSLTRLIKAACHGAYKATLDEVEQIQKEYQDERFTAKPGEA